MTSISPRRSGLPSRSQRHARTRAVSAVLGADGLTMLLAPRWVVGHLTPGRAAPHSWVVRLLGARSVAQHALLLAHPTRQAVQLGAVADVVHAASMAPAAALWPRYRRAAAISAAFSTVSAAVQWAVAPQSEHDSAAPGDLPLP